MNQKYAKFPFLGEFFRFLMTGGMNTLLTVALYQGLVSILSAPLSYSIAWIVGFLFVLIAYPKFVFRSNNLFLKKTITLLLFYLGSFLIGLFLTWFLMRAGVNERLSIFIVIGVTSGINFIVGKFLYGRNAEIN